MTATDTTTTVLVAGLDMPVIDAKDRAYPPHRPDRKAKGWVEALPTLALMVNGTEISPELMPQVRYLYGDDYRISTVPNPDTGKVRVLFTPHDDDDDAPAEVFVGTGRYKGAITRKV